MLSTKKKSHKKTTENITKMPGKKTKIRTDKINLYYGNSHALKDVTMEIPERAITAFIGPSGCGKTSLLRLFNRMNDLIPIARVEGDVYLDETPIYGNDAYVVEVRHKIGMVFQKPNMFPMSIRDNITIGPRHHKIKRKSDLDEIVERTLTQVGLWKSLKDDLHTPALSLSAGEQQRLCIARALAVNPEVLLMDESCSALDPESTMQVEALMNELAKKYTILIVTHSMEQARRVADMCAFLMIDDKRVGTLVEYAPAVDMFSSPKDKRTEDYITGRYG